jgi:hypothetical protein
LIGERDWRHIQLVAPQQAQIIRLTDVNTNGRETSLMVGICRVEELNLVGPSKRRIVDKMAAGEHVVRRHDKSGASRDRGRRLGLRRLETLQALAFIQR